MSKVLEERNILELAKPILGEIYGNFQVVPEQTDRPDAAIISDTIEGRIGIEITSVDGTDVQQYFNDEKFGRDIESKLIDDVISSGKHSDRPTKKLSIPFPKSYIADGVLKKIDKHSEYFASGEYEEIILISFSEYLEIRGRHFESYHKPWTWHLLKEKSFPFSKVIFVCKNNGDSSLVYDKNAPAPEPPECDPDKELGITRTIGPIIPPGKMVNLYKIISDEPHIAPREKHRKKGRKNSRKISRKK
ncbi:hypothetical protein CWC05_03480 [Pseudoalteromonas ruthenica]|uniref:Uncharacterized protein n=1 Tax=Pseudoalteromonas ruthenica TaxID=151081 RepID=A0A5S3Z8I2_9GAMM|nr:hypothetical protein [Pseudoalteromonas ruthenica]TMP88503.1 hypothetical protein CWC05_03480 [Pseudoalteromonas ruthenica]